MNPIFTLFGDSDSIMVTLLVFLASATFAFSIMAVVRVRGSVRRRAAGISAVGMDGDAGSLRGSSRKAAQRLVDYTTRHYSADDSKDMKVLRQRLIRAGIFDSSGVAYFFIARTGLAVGLAMIAFFFAPFAQGTATFWVWIGVGGIVGYVAPSVYLDRRISARMDEHRSGFPDFMDLLVVCADAGLSMEAALDRVGSELADSYPSLTANIHMANLEIRAGRTLTEALRVYSDDMRHKRMSRAEEKAYSLPAKLSVPLTLCVFPVVIIVILLPVFVRLKVGNY